jgi:hypothetical protein
MSESSERLPRRIPVWKVLGSFVLASVFVLLGIVFIPWDSKPVIAPDLQVLVPAIAPEANAFTWFAKAAARQVTEFPGNPDGRPVDEGLANAAVFPELEMGLACLRYVPPQAESLEAPLPWEETFPHLAELLCLKSRQRQLAGDPAGAVKPALQALHLGQLVAGGSNTRSGWIVGIRQQDLALKRLEELVADAKTSDPALAEIQACLDLWTPAGLVAGYQNAMRGEYTRTRVDQMKSRNFYSYEMVVQKILFLQSPWNAIPYLFKPNMTCRDLATYYRCEIKNAGLPYPKISRADYPHCLDFVPVSFWTRAVLWARPNALGRIYVFLNMFAPGIEEHFSLQATVGALRLKIALRHYEQKHGRLPDDLGALVPDYLPAIPNDPFKDQPFRYSKEKKRVWSVGFDGLDDPPNLGDPDGENDIVMPLGTREIKQSQAGDEWTNVTPQAGVDEWGVPTGVDEWGNKIP